MLDKWTCRFKRTAQRASHGSGRKGINGGKRQRTDVLYGFVGEAAKRDLAGKKVGRRRWDRTH